MELAKKNRRPLINYDDCGQRNKSAMFALFVCAACLASIASCCFDSQRPSPKDGRMSLDENRRVP